MLQLTEADAKLKYPKQHYEMTNSPSNSILYGGSISYVSTNNSMKNQFSVMSQAILLQVMISEGESFNLEFVISDI